MSVVNTNTSASISQAAIHRNERELSKLMEQLSTGSKINSAADDAAGLAMATKFTSQIKGLDMAVKNANDGISMISTAEGALNEVTNMLQRMRELAVQSSNGTMTDDDRTYMNKEYQQLDKEIDRIEKNTQWNSTNVLDGTVGSSGTVTFQVSANFTAGSGGAISNEVISVDFGNLATDTVGLGDVKTMDNANTAVGALDTAIKAVNEQRATFGAASNRLEHSVDNMTNIKVNAEASRSRIEDTDYAQATAELAKAQIIQQAATAMWAQANQLPQHVLCLLK